MLKMNLKEILLRKNNCGAEFGEQIIQFRGKQLKCSWKEDSQVEIYVT